MKRSAFIIAFALFVVAAFAQETGDDWFWGKPIAVIQWDGVKNADRKELDALERNWRDQFGTLPEPVANMLVCAGMKLAAAHAGISSVEIKDRKLMLSRKQHFVQLNGKFPRLTEKTPTLQLREALLLLRNF